MGAALLVAGGDAAAWAAAIERLVDDPGARERLGTTAAAFVAASLSLGAAAERLAEPTPRSARAAA